MRVAMIGPDLNAKGGIASLARSFVESAALSGVDIRYLASVGNGSLARRVGQMALGEARWLDALARGAVGGWRPDLVHIHVSDGGSFYRKLAYMEQARAAGLPVVLHNNFAHLEELVARSKAHAALVGHAYAAAAQVHVVSHDMARQIEAWTDGRATIRVLFNPVDVTAFAPPEPGPTPEVLFMGYVGDRKGIFDLVEAWPAVLARVPDARLRVGGNGEVDRLRELVTKLGLDASVEVMGWVSGEQRSDAFRRAHVYCLPSYAEGQPVSVIEAMAAGLAVVSTDVDGIPDAIVEGETGFMVAPGDKAALADRLVTLLQDGALRERFGRAARARAEAVFDREVLSATLLGYWREILA